jgi:hypothetical protein
MKKHLLPAVLTLALGSLPVIAAAQPVGMPQGAMPNMPSYQELMHERQEHMQHMQAFMDKVRAAKTPEERQKLMDEHMRDMEAEMRKQGGPMDMPAMPAMPEFPAGGQMPPMMGDPSMGYMPMPEMPGAPGMDNSAMEAYNKAMQAYMEKMQAAKTPEERQQIMAEHKQAMRALAPQRDPRMDGRGPYARTPNMPPRGMMGPRMSPVQEMYQRMDELEKKVEELQQQINK